jgi:hypothetical protein
MRLNPILLLDDILCTITNGGGVRIGWIASTGAPAARLLMEHGVKTWGYDMASKPDRRYCMVRPRQAKWAVALLRGAGYAVIEGPGAKPVAPRSTWGAPVGASGLGGLAANLLGVRPRNTGQRKRGTRR